MAIDLHNPDSANGFLTYSLIIILTASYFVLRRKARTTQQPRRWQHYQKAIEISAMCLLALLAGLVVWTIINLSENL